MKEDRLALINDLLGLEVDDQIEVHFRDVARSIRNILDLPHDNETKLTYLAELADGLDEGMIV